LTSKQIGTRLEADTLAMLRKLADGIMHNPSEATRRAINLAFWLNEVAQLEPAKHQWDIAIRDLAADAIRFRMFHSTVNPYPLDHAAHQTTDPLALLHQWKSAMRNALGLTNDNGGPTEFRFVSAPNAPGRFQILHRRFRYGPDGALQDVFSCDDPHWQAEYARWAFEVERCRQRAIETQKVSSA
jgi:hypothetical protein